MSSRSEARATLMRLATLPDDAMDVGEAALALAVFDRPDRPLAPYVTRLEELTEEVRALVGEDDADLERRVAALRLVLVERHDHRGDEDTYDDLRNANLMWMLDRRRGLPVAIGILFLSVAKRLGWPMSGLSFPGHFLTRIDVGPVRAIIDPFNGGREVQSHDMRAMLKATSGSATELAPRHYQVVSNREVLLRLQNNIKLRYIANDDIARALLVLERMRLFAPNEPAVWRETGLLEAHAGNPSGAIEALETFMHLSTSDRLRHQAAKLIQELRGRSP